MQTTDSFEDRYLDVLHNIESGILLAYRSQPELVDFDVETALNALTRHFVAEIQKRTISPVKLNSPAQAVYDTVMAMCEWRLGRAELGPTDAGSKIPQPEPITTDEIISCLKRIRKSVQRWNREGGRRGYLTFIQEYI